MTLIELLVVITILAIVMSLLLPSIALARSAAQNLNCLKRQSQFTMAMLHYADEHNGRYVPASGGWRGVGNYGYRWFSDLAPYTDAGVTLAAGGYGAWGSAGMWERLRQQLWAAMKCPSFKGRSDTHGPNPAVNGPGYDAGGFGINHVPGAPDDMRHTWYDWGESGTGRKVWRVDQIRHQSQRAWLGDADWIVLGRDGQANPTMSYVLGQFDQPTTYRDRAAPNAGQPRHRERGRANLAFFDGHVRSLRIGVGTLPSTGSDGRLPLIDPTRYQ